MKKTWFITGASRGFGRIWAEAALKRGDQVTATARKLADVADLRERFGDAVLPLALDVTNSEQVRRVVQQAYEHFGSLDVLVNNAGTSLFAATEEASDEQIRSLFDANYLGMVRVLRAALPLLRKQESGHILGVSSGLGLRRFHSSASTVRRNGRWKLCTNHWRRRGRRSASRSRWLSLELTQPTSADPQRLRMLWNHTRSSGSSF